MTDEPRVGCWVFCYVGWVPSYYCTDFEHNCKIATLEITNSSIQVILQWYELVQWYRMIWILWAWSQLGELKHSNEVRHFCITLTSFCNWPVFFTYFFSVAIAGGGSGSFSYTLLNKNARSHSFHNFPQLLQTSKILTLKPHETPCFLHHSLQFLWPTPFYLFIHMWGRRGTLHASLCQFIISLWQHKTANVK